MAAYSRLSSPLLCASATMASWLEWQRAMGWPSVNWPPRLKCDQGRGGMSIGIGFRLNSALVYSQEGWGKV